MDAKVVLITGGSSGIGKAIGTYLVDRGYTVYGTTRAKAKYPDFNAFPLIELNVCDEASIQAALSELFDKEEQIDVLINNAGVGITGPVEETPHQEVLKAFDTNFNGPLHMIKGVLPKMRTQKSGLIINITSIAGYMGLPYRGIYSASKAALIVATETMRMEIKAFGIKMSTIAPGDFATNIASGRYHAPLVQGSPYAQQYGASLNTINNHVDAGEDPIKVAKMVHKIINAKNPKVHYKVGVFMQKFSLFLKSMLPDKIYERLLLKHYKL